jgi:hypothetical protein
MTPPTALPDLDVARARRFVEERNAEMPFDARDQVRYELNIGPSSLTIVECRPPWREDYGPDWTRLAVARLRYVKARREWSLYWRDRHEKFHLYDEAAPTPSIQTLLDEVEADPTSIFWG